MKCAFASSSKLYVNGLMHIHLEICRLNVYKLFAFRLKFNGENCNEFCLCEGELPPEAERTVPRRSGLAASAALSGALSRSAQIEPRGGG